MGKSNRWLSHSDPTPHAGDKLVSSNVFVYAGELDIKFPYKVSARRDTIAE
jgi:hypothetical protein